MCVSLNHRKILKAPGLELKIFLIDWEEYEWPHLTNEVKVAPGLMRPDVEAEAAPRAAWRRCGTGADWRRGSTGADWRRGGTGADWT